MRQSRHKKHKKSHGKAAESRIKEGGRQASQREIIRDQRRRHGQDPYEVLDQRIAGSGVDTSDCSSQQERKRETECDTINDIAFALRFCWGNSALRFCSESAALRFCWGNSAL